MKFNKLQVTNIYLLGFLLDTQMTYPFQSFLRVAEVKKQIKLNQLLRWWAKSTVKVNQTKFGIEEVND